MSFLLSSPAWEQVVVELRALQDDRCEVVLGFLRENEVPFVLDRLYSVAMKKLMMFLILALTSYSLFSCSSGTAAGKALDGVNQAGRAANSVRAISSFF